jgi:DNA repair exonuclease SbcCD ATPase subunit
MEVSGKLEAATAALSKAEQRADALDGQVATLASEKELAEKAVTALKKKLAAAEAAARQAASAADAAAEAAARDLSAMQQQRDAEAATSADRAARIAALEDMLRVANDEVAALSASLRDAKNAAAMLEKERNGLRAQVKKRRTGATMHAHLPHLLFDTCMHAGRDRQRGHGRLAQADQGAARVRSQAGGRAHPRGRRAGRVAG